jgi:hypothetical protein
MRSLLNMTEIRRKDRGRGVKPDTDIQRIDTAISVLPGENFKTRHILRRYYTNLGQRSTKDSYSMMILFISLFIGEHSGGAGAIQLDPAAVLRQF